MNARDVYVHTVMTSSKGAAGALSITFKSEWAIDYTF